MTRYDFIEARCVIFNNVQSDSNFTYFSYELGIIMTRCDVLDAIVVIGRNV